MDRSAYTSVAAVNRAYYEAFERRDLAAMDLIWEHSDRTVCTHPGWSRLHGWEAIRPSFAAIFRAGESLQFIITDEQVEVAGDVGWVVVDENLWGEEVQGTVSAMNVFVRAASDGGWRMVAHHASPVNQRL